MKRKARHWIHCTDEPHGQTWEVGKRSRPTFIGEAEPATPRLCVCPCVAGCIAARLFHGKQDVHVYQTVRPRRAVKPRDVHDAILTGERWLVPPVTMTLVQIVPAQVIADITGPQVAYLRIMREPLDIRHRAHLLHRAIARLALAGIETPRFWREFAERLVETWPNHHLDPFETEAA